MVLFGNLQLLNFKFDAYPDPPVYSDADPDPVFNSDAVPNLASQIRNTG
jgi:hypothetical protein